MANQKSNQSYQKRNSGNNRNAKSNRNSKPNQEKDYYSLKTVGLGYVNYLTEHESNDGSKFTTCKIAAKVGSKSADNIEYRYFDVTVRGNNTVDLLWDYEQELNDEEGAALVKFVLSDIKAKYYTNNDNQIVATTEAYLIGIEKIWHSGEIIYESHPEGNNSQNDEDDQEQQDERPSKGQSSSRSGNRQSQTGKAPSSSRSSAGKGSSRSSDSSRSSSSSRKRNAA